MPLYYHELEISFDRTMNNSKITLENEGKYLLYIFKGSFNNYVDEKR